MGVHDAPHLIAQGLIDAYDAAGEPDPRLLEFALARLRQLSAHEVGHTLGLAHNFAASTEGRASVMDYPHPYVTLDDDGAVDLSEAYDTGIGEWDKRTIMYSYSVFPEGEADSLEAILRGNEELGLSYITDREARHPGGSHPAGHLWDNGADAVEELRRIGEVRAAAMASFDTRNLAPSRPVAELEHVFVPLYLGHRYQVEACAKTIGGVDYAYDVNDGNATPVTPLPAERQASATAALLATLEPGFLEVPDEVLALIPPQPLGYTRNRELFDSRTVDVFDPWAAAEASIDHTLGLMLEPGACSDSSSRGPRLVTPIPPDSTATRSSSRSMPRRAVPSPRIRSSSRREPSSTPCASRATLRRVYTCRLGGSDSRRKPSRARRIARNSTICSNCATGAGPKHRRPSNPFQAHGSPTAAPSAAATEIRCFCSSNGA